MNKFLTIIYSSKLDLTRLYIVPNSSDSLLENKFEIKPKDFLRFAKLDLKDGDEKGFINSLTNSKRAIDCQIDEALNKLGIKIDKKNSSIEDFMKLYDIQADISFKLKIIDILNLAPTFIISKTRGLRNKLEHLYQKPKLSEVKEALDITDLFIKSIEGKFTNVLTGFYLTDDKNYDKTKLQINFQTEKLYFKIKLTKADKAIEEVKISSNDKEFYGLICLMISYNDEAEMEDSLRKMMEFIGHPIPSEKISLQSMGA